MGTIYLGMSKMRRQGELKTVHKTPITEDCYIQGMLLDSTDCKVLCETGANKSFMSKTFYLNCPLLHSLHEFV